MNFLPFGNRNEGIGATDARRIVAGEWLDLWREKTGEIQRPNLDHIFKVQLGLATEELHASWFFRQTKHAMLDPGDEPMQTTHTPEPFMFATLDRWLIDLGRPLELKHTHHNNTPSQAAQYYMAQLQHQMMVTGADSLMFSAICGNQEPDHVLVSRDEAYCAKLLEQERIFWAMVVNKERPPAMGNDDGELAELAKQVPIDGLKPYDLSLDNEFVSLAKDYIELKPKADRFKQVDKDLRAKIPTDASEVTGGGLHFKRDARGAFRCTIQE